MFLNDSESQTVEAMAGRLVPGDAADPGAREAGAMIFIDRALAGAYSDLRPLYRDGIRKLDELSRERVGSAFVDLPESEQDSILRTLELEHLNPSSDELARLGYFFEVVREHVLQGLFCDPLYGGNRDAVGWKLVGFPGAYWGYAEYQGRRNFDATELPIQTLGDLRRKWAQDNDLQDRGAP